VEAIVAAGRAAEHHSGQAWAARGIEGCSGPDAEALSRLIQASREYKFGVAERAGTPGFRTRPRIARSGEWFSRVSKRGTRRFRVISPRVHEQAAASVGVARDDTENRR